MAQHPKIETIGSIGSIIFAILEVQVHAKRLCAKGAASKETEEGSECPKTKGFQKSAL